MEVSVVIPSLSASPLSADSLPPEVDDVVVASEPGPSVARNAGIERARYDTLVLLDDDVVFEASWFRSLVERVESHPDRVYAARGDGLLTTVDWPAGFVPGMSRVMGFHRRAWEDVGGFEQPDQIPHDPDYGSDTDFLMAVYEAGYTVEGLAHEWDHEDEPDTYSARQHLLWLLWLAWHHPRLVGPRVPTLILNGLRG